ncbi:M28 family metallopeptidase [Clostridium uliginosum]|uniref:Peptidase family M28 n=1 Tax=Clostridium uliginosum TaxID=119641 RepID=A0A1I1IM78_9CLOT|nr:M20/M25/M40 family metallo-hydrolase [Clostridium uliginosum]SFC37374.1 Peptidase family M28 [Clostridium uliginosum]
MVNIKCAFKLSIIVMLLVSFTGCSENINKKQNNNKIEQEVKIEIPNTKDIINTLCSDDFGGRLSGSDGDDKTENYIFKIIKDLKLDPLFEEGYYEPYTQDVYKKLVTDENDKPEKKELHNLVGVIKGSDSTKAVIISAHFDHIGYQDGKIIRGALDNASGVATLVQIADILKKESENKTFNQDIIIAFFDGEETGLRGSKAFVKDIQGKYSKLYNINIDCVGGKNSGKIALYNKSKISNKLTTAMKETFRNNNMNFSETQVIGAISDQRSFEEKGIPNIYILQENIKPYIHKETDTPDTLDSNEIEKVANVLSKFVETTDGNDFIIN